MIVTLTGYRGTGKTTLAPVLAARLGWEWVDADAELQRRAGRSIRDIFATDGEPEFRRLERQTLVDLLQRDRLIVAAGGGAILNENTRRDLRAAGPVVWLKASVDTIEQRLRTDSATAAQRPHLTSSGGRAEIEQLLAIREPLYRECASIVIETDSRQPDGSPISIEQLADQVLQELASHLGGSISGSTKPDAGAAT